MEYLSVDFETRSTVNLTKTGVYPYALHDSTSIICMAYAFGDGTVKAWRRGEPFPADVLRWVADGKPLRAHNAQFERVMWRDTLVHQVHLKPPAVPNLDQWHDTAAEAAAMALPRHLSKLASVLGVRDQKDDEGHKLMLQMCEPHDYTDDGEPIWLDEQDPEKLDRLVEYCKQDVRAERACKDRLRRLGPTERQVYLLDQKINDRGMRVDVRLVRAAKDVIEDVTEEARERLTEMTDGAITKETQVQRITEWVNEHSEDEIPNLQKATLRDILDKRPEEWDISEEAREMLQIRSDTAKTSNAKVDAILRCLARDDRVRGMLLYHGASTGRWSGRLVQPQNIPRPTIDDIERYIPFIVGGLHDMLKDPLETVSSMLRSMLVASPGRRLIAGDFSQIEARVLGWLAGEPYGEREYEKMGAAIYGLDPDEVHKGMVERQIGKNAVLGAGFQMGADRFQEQVWEQTGIRLSDEMAQRSIDTYRERKSKIKEYWYEIERKALKAVKNPGLVTYVGPQANIRYVVRGQFLWCLLPSGRPLAYALPEVHQKPTPWGEMKEAVTYCGINGYTRKWERMSTYGGHLTENVVQATARDVLSEAMLRLEDAGYPMVLTVHDEAVADVPNGQGSLDEFLDIMHEVPDWAEGLPIEAEGWEGQRYRK